MTNDFVVFISSWSLCINLVVIELKIFSFELDLRNRFSSLVTALMVVGDRKLNGQRVVYW